MSGAPIAVVGDAPAGVSFRELLAYTDLLARRWVKYFEQHPAALEVDVGGRTGTIRELVAHIFQTEYWFAAQLAGEEAPQTKFQVGDLSAATSLHNEAHALFTKYLDEATPEKLLHKRKLSFAGEISDRKMLTQALLHGVHHWAQVAMEVRQAGFPTDKPQDIILTDVID